LGAKIVYAWVFTLPVTALLGGLAAWAIKKFS
jgi:phosphate/sulfate permease